MEEKKSKQIYRYYILFCIILLTPLFFFQESFLFVSCSLLTLCLTTLYFLYKIHEPSVVQTEILVKNNPTDIFIKVRNYMGNFFLIIGFIVVLPLLFILISLDEYRLNQIDEGSNIFDYLIPGGTLTGSIVWIIIAVIFIDFLKKNKK